MTRPLRGHLDQAKRRSGSQGGIRKILLPTYPHLLQAPGPPYLGVGGARAWANDALLRPACFGWPNVAPEWQARSASETSVSGES